MAKKVFIELTSEENIKRLNIDPRLVDSFKRVMTKIQEYFDTHGYSEIIDYETIINNYLLPQESIDRNTIRQSEEFITALNKAKDAVKQLETIVSTKLDPVNDEQFLDDYIKKNYNVGLNFEVEQNNEQMHGGIYIGNLKTIVIKETLLTSDSNRLDETLCHEFIHFLTMCGKDKLNSVDQVMTPALYEPLTEMIASDIIGIQPEGYSKFCEFMEYINQLVGVNGYEFFLKRQFDPKYEEMEIPFDEIQDAFDKHRFHKEMGYMDDSELIDVVYSASTQLLFRNYESIDALASDMIKIYSAPRLYSNFENLEQLQDSIIDLYLSQNNINSPEAKEKIKKLIQIKNEMRLTGDKKLINVNFDNDTYSVDEQGNLYLKRLNGLYKLNQTGTLISYMVEDGILHIFTTEGKYNCNLNNVNFNISKDNLKSQQDILLKEIESLMNGDKMNRPYINQDTVSTVIARDTGTKAEILEPTQLKTIRPYIKSETMSMLQDKIKQYELSTKKKQLLEQNEMIQQMMNEQQVVANGVVVEEENDMGMSL